MPPRCEHGQEKWCRICGTVEAPKLKSVPPKEEPKKEEKVPSPYNPYDFMCMRQMTLEEVGFE